MTTRTKLHILVGILQAVLAFPGVTSFIVFLYTGRGFLIVSQEQAFASVFAVAPACLLVFVHFAIDEMRS